MDWAGRCSREDSGPAAHRHPASASQESGPQSWNKAELRKYRLWRCWLLARALGWVPEPLPLPTPFYFGKAKPSAGAADGRQRNPGLPLWPGTRSRDAVPALILSFIHPFIHEAIHSFLHLSDVQSFEPLISLLSLSHLFTPLSHSLIHGQIH